jgi:hypothetical protein
MVRFQVRPYVFNQTGCMSNRLFGLGLGDRHPQMVVLVPLLAKPIQSDSHVIADSERKRQ